MSNTIHCLDTKASQELETASLAFLKKIISYQSYPQKENQATAELLQYVLAYCQKKGFRIKNINNEVGWAEVGSGERLLAFPVHLDVVPPGTGWQTPPFELTTLADVMYARGISDNKASVAILLHLLAYINTTADLTDYRLRLILGTSEETGMACIKRYLLTEELPVDGFVPDGMYPLVNGEKGRLHLRITSRLLTSTPQFLINGGEQVNSVPEHCHLRLFNPEERVIDFQGRAAHAASPEKGENAIIKALVELIDNYPLASLKELISPFYLKTESESNLNQVQINYLGETTCNLGVISQEGDLLQGELDLRFGQDVTADELLTRIRQNLKHWEVTVIDQKPTHYVATTNKTVQALLAVYEHHTGKSESKPVTMGGGTYASYFENMVAFGPKFPEIRTHAHSSNEQMSKLVYQQNMQLYFSGIHCLMEEKQ